MPRKKFEALYYIYKITCTITDKYYIGMHKQTSEKDTYMGSGTRLARSKRKHGIENHAKEILEYLPDYDSLVAREKEIVNKEFIKDPMCMNLMTGGKGGFVSKDACSKGGKTAGKILSDRLKNDLSFKKSFFETQSKNSIERWKDPVYRNKLVEANTGKNNPGFGKTLSDDIKYKIGKANSIKQKGEMNSQYGTVWIVHEEFGKKKIKKELLSDYIKNGWIKGRNIKVYR